MPEVIEGMTDLLKTVDQIGKLPQRVVTKVAKAGANIDLKATKAHAPMLTGVLKKALKLIAERTSKKGKKVYEVTFNPDANNALVKVSKSGKRSYYPASQEFGFIARDGRYIPGYNYMLNAIEETAGQVQKTMLDTFSAEIDKVWNAKNGGE